MIQIDENALRVQARIPYRCFTIGNGCIDAHAPFVVLAEAASDIKILAPMPPPRKGLLKRKSRFFLCLLGDKVHIAGDCILLHLRPANQAGTRDQLDPLRVVGWCDHLRIQPWNAVHIK